MNRVQPGRGIGAVAGCLLALTFGGCALLGGKSASNSTVPPGAKVDAPVKLELRYKVVADRADFFYLSVQQPGGPDEKLAKDTLVTLVKRYGGYTQIIVHGITGYVATDEIAPRTAQEIAAEDAATLAQQAPPNALAPATNGPGGTYSIPPEASRETVLPVPDTGPTAKPTPNPMFRY